MTPPVAAVHTGKKKPRLLAKAVVSNDERNGMISGCFPLDPHYKAMPEAAKIKQLRDGAK